MLLVATLALLVYRVPFQNLATQLGQITYLYNYNANGYICDGIQRPMEVGNIGQFGTCNDFANCGNGSSSNDSSGAVPPARNGGTGIGTTTTGSTGNNSSPNWFAPLTPQGVIVASGDSWNGNSVKILMFR